MNKHIYKTYVYRIPMAVIYLLFDSFVQRVRNFRQRGVGDAPFPILDILPCILDTLEILPCILDTWITCILDTPSMTQDGRVLCSEPLPTVFVKLSLKRPHQAMLTKWYLYNIYIYRGVLWINCELQTPIHVSLIKEDVNYS